MQKLFIIVASFCFAMALALPYDLVQDEQGQHYYLLPVSRVRRDTDWRVEDGKKISIKSNHNIFKDDNSRLDGTAYGTKNLIDRNDPAVFGAKLDYNHNSGHRLTVQGEHAQNRGTQVKAEGAYNLYRNGPFHVDATGDYTRRFGGPGGTRSPSWNAWVKGGVDF